VQTAVLGGAAFAAAAESAPAVLAAVEGATVAGAWLVVPAAVAAAPVVLAALVAFEGVAGWQAEAIFQSRVR